MLVTFKKKVLFEYSDSQFKLRITMSSKKQSTLFKFGFKRQVHHRNQVVNIEGPETVSTKDAVFACECCKERFKTRAGLRMHSLWRCGSKQSGSNPEDNSSKIESHSSACKKVLNQMKHGEKMRSSL